MDISCDCFRPLQGVNPDDDCGNNCSRCGFEVGDRRCEVCKADFSPEEMEERSDGKIVCRGCYTKTMDLNN